MRIYQLEGFYYVGKHNGFTKAANAMPYPIGEPAVYQQVKALQEDLGLPLVQHVKGAGVQLTPEGRALHAFIVPFFEGLTPLERGLKSGKAGVIILAAPRIVLTDWLPPRLSKLRRVLPSISWQLLEENDNLAILPLLLKGEADLGINYVPEIPPPLHGQTVATFEAMAAVPLRHPLARRASLAPQDILQYPLILYQRGSLPRMLFEEAVRRLQLTYVAAIETTTSEAMLHLVAEGCGVAIVPRIREAKRSTSPPGVRLIPLPGIFESQPISLLSRKTPPSSLLQEVIGLLTST